MPRMEGGLELGHKIREGMDRRVVPIGFEGYG